MTNAITTVYCADMNGEKIQWLLMDNGVFSVSPPITVDDIKAIRQGHWHRPLVPYDLEHQASGGGPICVTTEIKDTKYWHEVKERIGTMTEKLE